MVRAFLEMVLGPLGVSLLDAYYANSLLINGGVVIYGLVMLVSWTNLSRTRSYLIRSVRYQLKEGGRAGTSTRVSAALSQTELPYRDALGLLRVPLVAPWAALLPRRAGLDAIKNLLPPQEIVAEALNQLGSLSAKDKDLLRNKNQWWR